MLLPGWPARLWLLPERTQSWPLSAVGIGLLLLDYRDPGAVPVPAAASAIPWRQPRSASCCMQQFMMDLHVLEPDLRPGPGQQPSGNAVVAAAGRWPAGTAKACVEAAPSARFNGSLPFFALMLLFQQLGLNALVFGIAYMLLPGRAASLPLRLLLPCRRCHCETGCSTWPGGAADSHLRSCCSVDFHNIWLAHYCLAVYLGGAAGAAGA